MILKAYVQLKRATKNSLDGLLHLFKSEFAARIEIYAFFICLTFLFLIKAPIQFYLLGAGLFLALVAIEALNTAIEVMVDRISPEISQMGKNAKDLGSFAVMCHLCMSILFIVYIFAEMGVSHILSSLSSPMSKAVCAALLFILSIGYFSKHKIGTFSRLLLLIATFLILVGFSVYFTSDFFTGVGVDYRVFYHLGTGLSGAGVGEYSSLIVANVFYAALVAFSIFIIWDILGHKKRKISKFVSKLVSWNDAKFLTHSQASKTSQKAMGFGLILASLFIHPLTGNLFHYFSSTTAVSHAGLENYTAYENVKLKKKKNVIYIYLESFERKYLDQTLFPDLAPNMSALENGASYSFNDVGSAAGTTFTIGGIVGSQCGHPLFTLAQVNRSENFDVFMPYTTCLGDYLKQNKYNTVYMGGADSSFAGKSSFLKSHGYDKVIGLSDHTSEYEKASFHNWGIYDEFLFRSAKKEILNLSKSREPFALSLLTLDTHHPSGHLSPTCKDLKYDDGKNEMLNAVHCSDKLAGEFIQDLLKSNIAKDTVFVVSSDHLAFKNDAYDLLSRDPASRRNLLFIYDPDVRSSKVISKPATLLDVSPTILSLLGSNQNKLGYGTNLLSDAETLNEKIPDAIKANSFLLAQKQPLIDKLWKRPNLRQGLTIDVENERVVFRAGRWLKTPLIILSDETGEVQDIIFDHPNINLREGYLDKRAKKSDSFIWVDDCQSMGKLDRLAVSDNGLTADDWCVSYKNKKDTEPDGFVVEETRHLSSKWIRENVLGLAD